MMPTMIFWKRGISLLSLTAMAAAQEVWDYGDPDLNPWTWWKRAVPDARYPPFATGRRFRMTSEVATKVEEAAPLTDERGVTLPCVVDPFAGSTRPLWLPFEVDDSERGTTVAADEEGEGFLRADDESEGPGEDLAREADELERGERMDKKFRR